MEPSSVSWQLVKREKKPRLAPLDDHHQRRLIKYWKNQPTLYDRQFASYKKLHKRQEAIENIALCIGMDATEVKRRLLSIRNRFIKEYKQNIDTNVISKWRHYEACNFLISHLRLHGFYSEAGSQGDIADMEDFEEQEAEGTQQKNITQNIQESNKRETDGNFQNLYNVDSQPCDTAFFFGLFVSNLIREKVPSHLQIELIRDLTAEIKRFENKHNINNPPDESSQ